MGISLKLLPVDALDVPNGKYFSAESILQLEVVRDLVLDIMDLHPQRLSAELSTPLGVVRNGDGTIDEAQQDWSLRSISDENFLEPLRWVTAAELLTLRSHEVVQEQPANRAAWAYLAELPPNTRIVLLWY